MIRRITSLLLLGALVASMTGCARKVSVETGQRINCRYGHVISNNVRTVQVPAADAGRYIVVTLESVCPRHQKLAALYEQAQKELEAGQTGPAAAKLKTIVASDPAFAQAATQLEVIKSGGKPTPDSGFVADTGGSKKSGATTKPKPKPDPATPGDDKPVGPVTTLESWVPATLSGFRTGVTAPDAVSLSREYLPQQKGDLEAIVLAAEQFTSPDAAAKELKAQISRYSKDVQRTQVAGRATTLGHDGGQFAALAFVQGSVLVVAEVHASPGVKAKALLGDLKRVATTLPVQ